MSTPAALPSPGATALAFDVRDLVVRLGAGLEQREILRGVSLSIPRQGTTCIIGESGSGKSIFLMALLGVLRDRPGAVSGGITFWPDAGSPGLEMLDGLEDEVEDLGHGIRRVSAEWHAALKERWRPLWGSRVGYVAQHGVGALDPTRPIGASIEESIRLRTGRKVARDAVREEAVRWLESLRFTRPAEALRLYPAQLSGGMAQRAVLAVVLARGARAVFADEPTTGLDPDSQDALIDLLAEQRRLGRIDTLVLVTHDFGVARRLADHIAVMEQGLIVDRMPAERLFGLEGPGHPVARRLLDEFFRLSSRVRPHRHGAEHEEPARLETHPPPERPGAEGGAGPARLEAHAPTERRGAEGGGPARLEAIDLRKHYLQGPPWRQEPGREVLSGVSLQLEAGEVIGLVGPSGTGKTTLAACLVGVLRPDSGRVLIDGEDLLSLAPAALRARRRGVQLLYQQPAAAIHPRMRVEEALLETATHLLGLRGAAAKAAVDRALAEVHMTGRRSAFPAQLSGGQLRRVGIARVLLLEPGVLVADEPTAGVDASLRAEVLQLLGRLCETERRTAILLISHDRQVIRYMADRVVALEDGRLCEVDAAALEPGHAEASETAFGG
jgi:peptide/nickel transport system ATP-binding protein